MRELQETCSICIHKNVCRYSTSFLNFADEVSKRQKEMLESNMFNLDGLDLTLSNPVCNSYRHDVAIR